MLIYYLAELMEDVDDLVVVLAPLQKIFLLLLLSVWWWLLGQGLICRYYRYWYRYCRYIYTPEVEGQHPSSQTTQSWAAAETPASARLSLSSCDVWKNCKQLELSIVRVILNGLTDFIWISMMSQSTYCHCKVNYLTNNTVCWMRILNIVRRREIFAM